MKYVLFYETGDLAKAPACFESHREHWRAFQEAGTLLMIGPYANPQEGALSIFTTAEAAEAFAQADPFVLQGVIARWSVRAWNEVLFPPL